MNEYEVLFEDGSRKNFYADRMESAGPTTTFLKRNGEEVGLVSLPSVRYIEDVRNRKEAQIPF